MDQQELSKKEKELELREADLNHREMRIHQNLETTVMKQENLRRAIEMASNSIPKLQPLSTSVGCVTELTELIVTATKLLKNEIENNNK